MEAIERSQSVDLVEEWGGSRGTVQARKSELANLNAQSDDLKHSDPNVLRRECKKHAKRLLLLATGVEKRMLPQKLRGPKFGSISYSLETASESAEVSSPPQLALNTDKFSTVPSLTFSSLATPKLCIVKTHKKLKPKLRKDQNVEPKKHRVPDSHTARRFLQATQARLSFF